jgi:cytochrome c oxidase assembly protein subunit 15
MAVPLAAEASIPPRSEVEAVGVRLWLFTMATLVFAMVIVGGATRLTDSGLSITEWQPILGAIPPLSAADWHDAFEKYRQIPEYHQVNKGMSLEAFKAIYWWEWAHRFLGRFIGIAFALPLAIFWWRGALRPRLALKLVGVLALGGLQGAIGWYMVQSGLVDRVDVSQYRLALHLTVAALLFALLIWLALERGPRRDDGTRPATPGQRVCAAIVLGVVLLQVVLGAFVAGLKAGLTYNTWPLMDGRFIPSGLATLQPRLLNLTENITTVQFNHRMTAYALLALALLQWVSLRRAGATPVLVRSAAILTCAVVIQACLGVWTLVAAEGAIPIGLGLAHQGGAFIVLGLAVRHLHLAMASRTTAPLRPRPASV